MRSPEPPWGPPARRKINWAWVIGIATVLALVVSIVLVLLNPRDDTPESSSQPSPTQMPASSTPIDDAKPDACTSNYADEAVNSGSRSDAGPNARGCVHWAAYAGTNSST